MCEHDQNIGILMIPLYMFIQAMDIKHDQNIVILMTPLHMFIQALDIKHDQNIVILMTPYTYLSMQWILNMIKTFLF